VFEVIIQRKAEKDLASVPKADALRITQAVLALRTGLKGDIKKLTNYRPEYRLRIGDWRVLFEVENRKIVVYRILHRREAYR